MAECPKCAALSDDDAVDCPQCGVVFAKFQQRAAVAALGAAASDTRAGRASAALRDPTTGLVRLAAPRSSSGCSCGPCSSRACP